MTDSIQLLNIDCLKFMASIPLGHFDLVIADPPYGIGRDWERRSVAAQKFSCDYDNTDRPSPEVFNEIIRVAKHWIIFGWNYFTDILPPTNYLIVWDKMSNCNQKFHYSKAEIAGTDIKIPCNLVSIPWDGYRMGEETGTKKIHPHQKPVALYRWLLTMYGRRARRIFDPFAGSGSLAVACSQLGKEYVGCELDKTFYKNTYMRLFDNPPLTPEPEYLPFMPQPKEPCHEK